jgi:orotidine-5'-phosphate decarboxylase
MTGLAEAHIQNEPATARDRLIIGLDVCDIAQARAIVDELAGEASFYRIGGHLLFVRGLVGFIEELVAQRQRIFLDLKSVDIGEPMRAVAARAAELGVELLSVIGTKSTIAAAIDGRAGRRQPKILVVTVLTGHGPRDLAREYGTGAVSIEPFVVKRARIASQNHADGIISSPLEIGAIRAATRPGFLVVTPGMRPSGGTSNDRRREATPSAALAAGADFLVIGHPIAQARDKLAATRLILDEMQEFLDRCVSGGAPPELRGAA